MCMTHSGGTRWSLWRLAESCMATKHISTKRTVKIKMILHIKWCLVVDACTFVWMHGSCVVPYAYLKRYKYDYTWPTLDHNFLHDSPRCKLRTNTHSNIHQSAQRTSRNFQWHHDALFLTKIPIFSSAYINGQKPRHDIITEGTTRVRQWWLASIVISLE